MKSRTCVAVADNDAVMRESLALVLGAHGYDIRIFASGSDLLRGHEAGPARCIVMDCETPGHTGFDVLKVLRGRGDTTPVILLTGKLNSLHAKVRALGGADVLLKPLLPAELIATLQKLVAG